MKIVRKFRSGGRRILNLARSITLARPFNIVDEEIGRQIVTIKDETVEPIYFPPVFELSTGGRIDYINDRLSFREIDDATVYHGSDFVTTGQSVLWKKFFLSQWQKMIPSDAFMFKREGKKLYINKPRKVFSVDLGFSMLGVHSHIWTHFLMQHFPKLMCLDAVADGKQTITILHPFYEDAQVSYLFRYFAGLYPKVSFLEIGINQAVFCRKLYYLNNTSQISDHATYIAPSDIIVPRFVLDLLKNNLNTLLERQAAEITPERESYPSKIYIGRRGQRGLLNPDEVESFFVSRGFEIIHPERYTLVEKYRLFRHAEIIAGPGSSGFTNMIFCKPGTRILLFSNYQRLVDAFSFYKYFGIRLLVLNDQDSDQTIHASYTISIDKLARSYAYLLNDVSFNGDYTPTS